MHHRTTGCGFVRSEWLVVVVVLTLGVSLILRALNIWIQNERLEKAALMLGTIPVALIAALLVASLAVRPFLDRRLRQASPGAIPAAHAREESPTSAEPGNDSAATPDASAQTRGPAAHGLEPSARGSHRHRAGA